MQRDHGQEKPVYQRIYEQVRRIPPGSAATYGDIARLAGAATPRLVGFALAALPEDSDAPWHRVVNREGRISLRSDGRPCERQRVLLEAEGFSFDAAGRVDLTRHRWGGVDDKT
jgi:methylated-DNA-protein-cysteine methyltransferase-like protein